MGEIADPGGGPWYTGYTSHGDDWYIFCSIGVAGKTGHDYANRFAGTRLVWYGKSNAQRDQPAIQRMLSTNGAVHIFYRQDQGPRFTYAGAGRPAHVADTVPVCITWELSPGEDLFPDEVPSPAGVWEGAKKSVTVNLYERDASARRRCIAHWGTTCSVCGFSFEQTYGELGCGFIHVHHLKPVAEVGEQYILDPIADQRPVCPNCHAMLHRESPAIGIAELQALIVRA